MDKLSLADAPPHSAAAAPPPARRAPQPPSQLPPQMFTTAAQLLDFTDKKLAIVLRDGRKLIGVLRSWDQFANLVLQSTTERIYAARATASSDAGDSRRGLYADIHHGVFLVRGENVLMLGEIDLDKDDDAPPGYQLADLDMVKKLAEERKTADKPKEKARLKKLARIGFEGENVGEVIL